MFLDNSFSIITAFSKPSITQSQSFKPDPIVFSRRNQRPHHDDNIYLQQTKQRFFPIPSLRLPMDALSSQSHHLPSREGN